jgi:DNA-binding MarR family transcriptional regulator
MNDLPPAPAERERGVNQPGNPALTAFMGMARVAERVERLLTSGLKCHRLNPGQLDVLLHAAAAEGLTQQELAERLCHSKANVSQLLDKMEAAGLVRRVPEGRAYGVFLTDAGREMLGASVPALERLIAEQFAPLAPAEQAELARLVGKLDAGAD